MEKKTELNLVYWMVALFAVMLLQSWWVGRQQVEPVPYSEFERYLAEGKVGEVVVTDRLITGKLKSPEAGGKTAIVAARVEPDLAERLAKYGVTYRRVVEDTFLRDLLSWIVPALVFLGLWYFLFRRFAEKQGLGGFMAIGKSRAKVYVEKARGSPSTTWPGWTRPRRS